MRHCRNTVLYKSGHVPLGLCNRSPALASLLLSSVSSVDLLSNHAQGVHACYGSFQIHCSLLKGFYVVILLT